jgi:hypothetical protein
MKKFAFAAVVTVACVGFVMADEFNGSIQKVDAKAGTVTYVKGGFGGGFGKKGGKKDEGDKAPEPVTAKLAKGAKIAKGAFKKSDEGFKMEVGEALAKGLEDEAFTKAGDKGVFAQITTADADKGDVKKGEITQILVFGGFGGKKKGGGQ